MYLYVYSPISIVIIIVILYWNKVQISQTNYSLFVR